MQIDYEKEYKLCMEICSKIEQKYSGQARVDYFSETERVVIVALTVAGIIGNGGFEYLLSSTLPGDPYLVHTLNTLKILNIPGAVGAIESILQYFPEGKLPTDEVERMEIYNTIDEKIRDEIDLKFWSSTKDLIHNLALYIKLNCDEFSSIQD